MAARIAYSIPEAAEATGVSESSIRRAIASGDLIASYPTSKPVIAYDVLVAWIANAPTERAS
jgi:hypothetical protein